MTSSDTLKSAVSRDTAIKKVILDFVERRVCTSYVKVTEMMFAEGFNFGYGSTNTLYSTVRIAGRELEKEGLLIYGHRPKVRTMIESWVLISTRQLDVGVLGVPPTNKWAGINTRGTL